VSDVLQEVVAPAVGSCGAPGGQWCLLCCVCSMLAALVPFGEVEGPFLAALRVYHLFPAHLLCAQQLLLRHPHAADGVDGGVVPVP
jgi:hypothetical protein